VAIFHSYVRLPEGSHVSSLAQWFFKCLRLIEEEMCDEWNQDKVGIVWIQRLGPGVLCCLCFLELCPVWPLWFDIFWARILDFTPQPSMFGLTHEHLWLWYVVTILHWMNVTIGYHRCFYSLQFSICIILHEKHARPLVNVGMSRKEMYSAAGLH
jgi:hypothetical protein